MFSNRCIEPNHPMPEAMGMNMGMEKMEMPNMTEGHCHPTPAMFPGAMCQPVYECPQERCCHRQIVHNVPHIVPIKTKIINHHIYRHTFTPQFTCCEENICSNVFDGSHCGF